MYRNGANCIKVEGSISGSDLPDKTAIQMMLGAKYKDLSAKDRLTWAGSTMLEYNMH